MSQGEASAKKRKGKKAGSGFWSEGTSIVLSYLTLFLVVIILIVGLLLTRYVYTWWECGSNPNISCFDDWYCPGSAYPQGSTGYASSLFGPNSFPAAGCNYLQAGATQCALATSTCTADQTVPLGCSCSFSGAGSTCLMQLCSFTSPGWTAGALNSCSNVEGAGG